MQDLLRITTNCQSAEEIWKSLPISAQQAIGDLRDAEEQALRAFALGPGLNASSDCPMLKQLQSHYETLAAFLHQRPMVRIALDRMIRTDFNVATY